ncbi:MAG TPA: hypothetical protein VHD61_04420 [Lacunisphaera sp.]|nr:hypothetical protein [Lacunisphaera sp.]
MDWPVLLSIPFRLALMLAGLVVPGSMLLRGVRLPWSLAAAFASSAAILYALVLLFACTGVPFSLYTLALGLAAVALGLRAVKARPAAAGLSSSFSCFTRMRGWLPLYLAFWIIVAWRLCDQPLSGPDVNFRWSWLAEQMLRFGTLDFYPPQRGADFAKYFWAESIPPGVAGLYAWAYACAGGKQALWTSPVVALQLLGLHEMIWRLGSRWGGELVARRAVLLAAACPLLTWSVVIGQETGLTALALVGAAWCLHHLRVEHHRGWVVLAAIFAVIGAGAREYGPVLALVIVAAAAATPLPRPRLALLAAVAVPLALAWPLRVFLLTGNPVYSLGLGGLVPVNVNFTDWNDLFRAGNRFDVGSAGTWVELGRHALLWAFPAATGFVALIALLGQRLPEARSAAWLIAPVAVLWFVSVFYTAGGLFYSLRVLSPVLALLTVVAAYSIGLFVPAGAMTALVSAMLACLVVESLPKTLVLPENPYRVPWRQWAGAGDELKAAVRTENQALLARLQPLAGRKRVITDNAGLPRVLEEIGTEALPLWTPEVAWLFDSQLPAKQIADRWQRSGLHYFVLTKSKPTEEFLRTHARWRAPYFTVKMLSETDSHMILEVEAAPGELR